MPHMPALQFGVQAQMFDMMDGVADGYYSYGENIVREHLPANAGGTHDHAGIELAITLDSGERWNEASPPRTKAEWMTWISTNPEEALRCFKQAAAAGTLQPPNLLEDTRFNDYIMDRTQAFARSVQFQSEMRQALHDILKNILGNFRV